MFVNEICQRNKELSSFLYISHFDLLRKVFICNVVEQVSYHIQHRGVLDIEFLLVDQVQSHVLKFKKAFEGIDVCFLMLNEDGQDAKTGVEVLMGYVGNQVSVQSELFLECFWKVI
jgi:hypothetical protein